MLDILYAVNCSSTKHEDAPWNVFGSENTFDVDYVTLYNWIETLGNELQLYKVEPCNIYFDSGFNGALLIFTRLFDSCIDKHNQINA